MDDTWDACGRGLGHYIFVNNNYYNCENKKNGLINIIILHL